MIASKLSVQGVKSLWGDCRVFPVLSTFVYAPPVSVPNTGKTLQLPQSDLIPWTLTLIASLV